MQKFVSLLGFLFVFQLPYPCLAQKGLFEKSKITECVNLKYGKHERQVLDVVYSEKLNASPVIIFIHGGSWRWGQKDYHRTIGKQFAKKGIVFLTINYRLYPNVRFPSFPEDVALSVKWAREKINRFGGNPEKLFLMGHSAGAHSASLVGLDDRYLKNLGGDLDWISGVIPMACPFYFEPHKEFLYRDLFPASIDTDSFMPMGIELSKQTPPFFIMHGFFDPIIRNEQAFQFAEKLKKNGSDAHVKLYKSHGHFSLVRRTTSWHIWPNPLLSDVTNFVMSKS
ncbi:MAG: hypothetical protein CMI23_09125 [Opitutae bacterium]|nr:hypothetical protein [Opitutae bacterium]